MFVTGVTRFFKRMTDICNGSLCAIKQYCETKRYDIQRLIIYQLAEYELNYLKFYSLDQFP